MQISSPGLRRLAVYGLVLASLGACDDGSPTEPVALEVEIVGTPDAHFADGVVGSNGTTALALRVTNVGGRAVGPVRVSGHVSDGFGSRTEAVTLRFDPGTVPTLNPGAMAEVTATLTWSGGVVEGEYDAQVRVEADGATGADRRIPFRVRRPASPHVGSVRLTLPDRLLRGEGVASGVEVRDTLGQLLADEVVRWSFTPADGAWAEHGVGFVATRAGELTVVARVGALADTAVVEVSPRTRRLTVTPVGNAGLSRRHTSDLWVRGDAAWTGTWGTRITVDGPQNGDMLYSWRVGDGSPVLTDSLRLDARTVNDIKVHPTRPLAVATHEGSNDGLNGVTLLDLDDPHHPRPITRYTHGLASGVHNAWLDGDHLYLVLDGRGNGLRILDISDPADPFAVASVYEGASFLHDVLVRDGLAFLSQWNDGLVIVDVGHGIAGGSPTAPVEVSRIVLDGETHNAWYWPDRSLVVVGEEDFQTPGRLSFIDVSDLRRPRRVGVWEVPGTTPHNVWVDEEAEVLWAAWYGNGLQALDLSGTAFGPMHETGRELASVRYAGGSGSCAVPATCSWAPQLEGGRVYVADMNAGLVVLEAREER